ncbi:MAG: glycosyltransferase [Saprospiraceae bacterium]|nr:glycosyltransferase [Saprospiraceae bacterium]
MLETRHVKKKILIIPSWVPTKKSPNSGRIIFSQFNDLVEAGVNVNLAYVSDIFTPHILNKEFLVYERQIYRKKILFSYKRFKITRCIWINKYFRIIEEIGVDNIGLIHAHSYIAGYVASRIKNKYGIRYIVTERSPDFFTNNIHKSFKSSIYNIYEDAEFVLCVSNILRHKFKALFNNECKVFPNYVNVIQDVFKRKFDLFTIVWFVIMKKLKIPSLH